MLGLAWKTHKMEARVAEMLPTMLILYQRIHGLFSFILNVSSPNNSDLFPPHQNREAFSSANQGKTEKNMYNFCFYLFTLVLTKKMG